MNGGIITLDIRMKYFKKCSAVGFFIFFIVFQIRFIGFVKEQNRIINIGKISELPEKPLKSINKLVLNKGQNYIHDLIYFRGYVYVLAATNPSIIIKLDQNNLRIIKILTFPPDGRHNHGMKLTQLAGKNRIYAVFGGINEMNISEIDPESLTFRDAPRQPDVFNGQDPSITTDGEFIFVLTNTKPSIIRKVSPENLKQISFVTLSEMNYGHGMKYDGKFLYATGNDSPAWLARVDPKSLKYSGKHFLPGDSVASDDIAVTDKWVFIGIEKHHLGDILIIDKTTLKTVHRISTGINAPCYGVFLDKNYIWALFDTRPGKIVRFNLNNFKADKYILGPGENAPSQMVMINNQMILGTFTDPAVIANFNFN